VAHAYEMRLLPALDINATHLNREQCRALAEEVSFMRGAVVTGRAARGRIGTLPHPFLLSERQ
jgi:hypothetical protein